VRLSVADAGRGVHFARAEVEFRYHAPSAGNWLLGNANGDTRVDLSDAVQCGNFAGCADLCP
jgi:hypothetical protein